MALLGRGAIAMWWDIEPARRAEFEDWHTHEHFPERMGIPGFLRGSRWGAADGGAGFFVMYELDAHDVVASAAYLAHLNAPTPWSTQMMPHHRNMVRSQCRVLESVGGALSRHALTVRLSPAGAAEGDPLRAHLRDLARQLARRPGTAAAHLLRHEAPRIAQTTEQKIRGADAVADWVFIVCGYERSALEQLAAGPLADKALVEAGAQTGAVCGLYTLAHSNTAADVA